MKSLSHSSDCEHSTTLPRQFCPQLIARLGRVKTQLQEKFEQAYPGSAHLVHQAVAEADALAWETSFPHLFLPDFAEARLAEIVGAREPVFAHAA